MKHEQRLKVAWMRWRDVTSVLCDSKIPTCLKSLVCKTLVRPVALYGAECWSTTKTKKDLLHEMEMRMLRWTLGFTRINRIRNTTVRQEKGVIPITERMREYRLR